MSQEHEEVKSVDSSMASRYAPLAVCVFLAAAVVIVFGQTVHHDFINYDDPIYVTKNRNVIGGLTADRVAWAMTTGHGANWHPVTWFSHQLDCQIYDMNAAGHHATSVLLHAVTAILLFLVLWRMTGDLWPGAFVATVFAIHPLRVESVAWVAERKDVLCGLFFMLTLAAYLHYVRRPSSIGRYLTVIAVFAIGLMSKPMLVTVPFVLLLLDYWPLGRMTSSDPSHPRFSFPSRLILEKVPLLLLTVVSCIVTSRVQTEAIVQTECLSLSSRAGNAVVSCVTYLYQSFLPTDLAPLYQHPGGGLPAWKIAAASAILLAISAVALACWRRIPCLIVGWLWYLGMLVPVIGLVQVGMQAHADRYTYLPQIGLLIALAWGVKHVTATWPHRRWIIGTVSSIVVAALMGCAWHQTAFWRNSETLWEHTVQCSPDNNVAENELGTAVMVQEGRLRDAVPHFRKALEIFPEYVEARRNLGSALMKMGHADEAMKQYETALKTSPDDATANADFGAAATELGHPEIAERHLKKALDLDPSNLEARVNYGIALATLGKVRYAIEQFIAAIDLDPGCAEAHHNLAITFVRVKRPDLAIREYEETLRIKPDWAEAHENLGAALKMQGRIGEAKEQYRQALALALRQNKPQLVEEIKARLGEIPGR
jgi:protein O-mannosyl-transferase